MVSPSAKIARSLAVCLLVLPLLLGSLGLSPLNAQEGQGSTSCTTPDPFVILGGGICVNGGWLPPGVPAPPPVIPAPIPEPPPVPPPSSSSSSCVTPDPFVALGGGICVNGGWLPPGASIPVLEAPSPASPVPPAPAPAQPVECSTPDPFATIGGGVCLNGGWIPAASAPPPATPSEPSSGCHTADPFSAFGGGLCADGEWVPLEGRLETRITGTVRQQDDAWLIQTAAGVRFFLLDGLVGSGLRPGSVVTLKGIATAPPLTSVADRLVMSVTEFTPVPAGSPMPVGSLVDDRNISVRSPETAAARRSALIDFIWGGTGFPFGSLPTVLRDDSSPVSGLENLQRVDTLVMDLDEGRSGYAHYFVPMRSNSRAVILHQGHACSFDDGESGNDVGLGMRRTLNALLFHGYSVVTLYMPNQARFRTSRLQVDDCFPTTHYGLFSAGSNGSGSPLKFFLTPTVMALNYLAGEGSFTDYSMIGLSGGGWTTTVYAALDPRIRTSVHVGGSLPLYLQRLDQSGDSEQILEAFYSIAGYPDLYVLGASGPGRRQVQILNRLDDCCFSPRQTLPGTSEAFDAAVRAYERDVRTAVSEIGDGNFRLEIDEAASGHMISWNSLLNQILPELNEAHQQVGASTSDVAFVRGVNGNLWRFSAGSWLDTGLSIVGVPAVVQQENGEVEVFFRNPSNRLTRGRSDSGSWQAQDLGVTVVSDPAATSWGAGRVDVVSIDASYAPVHWWMDGGVTTGAAVPVTGDRGIGRAALVTNGAGRLQLFMQGRSDRRLHVLQFEASMGWSAESVASTMLDFPGAVVDQYGVVHAFFRGASNALWQAASTSGGWELTNLSSVTAGRKIQGSPSASLLDGSVVVHARTAQGLAVFRGDDSWSMQEFAGAFVGSPTSTRGAAHARSMNQDLWLFATSWVWRGGPPE